MNGADIFPVFSVNQIKSKAKIYPLKQLVLQWVARILNQIKSNDFLFAVASDFHCMFRFVCLGTVTVRNTIFLNSMCVKHVFS